VAAAVKQLGPGHTIVTILCDMATVMRFEWGRPASEGIAGMRMRTTAAAPRHLSLDLNLLLLPAKSQVSRVACHPQRRRGQNRVPGCAGRAGSGGFSSMRSGTMRYGTYGYAGYGMERNQL